MFLERLKHFAEFIFTGFRAPARTLYICHGEHPNELVYAENLTDFFRNKDIATESIALSSGGQRPELRRCLRRGAVGVLGMNSQLDHSWIKSENFLTVAARAKVPIIHWIVDHSSTRWPEFTNATAANSRFLFLSPFSETFFQQYVLPGSITGHTTGNTGVSRHSRLDRFERQAFMERTYNCLIPLNFRRIGGTFEDAMRRRNSLGGELAAAVDRAIDTAYPDLDHPIEKHFLDALKGTDLRPGNDRINFCLQIIEEIVQIRRRRWIFEIARDYPVMIQSDETARPYAAGGRASFEADVGMKATYHRMKQSRSVLNTSHVNDELHNRTINGLNAGCANIVEDTVIHRRLFTNGKTALFFRYDDDSLRRCLDIVCADRERTYSVAGAGFALRDKEPFRFGGFDAIVRLAQTALPAASRAEQPALDGGRPWRRAV